MKITQFQLIDNRLFYLYLNSLLFWSHKKTDRKITKLLIITIKWFEIVRVFRHKIRKSSIKSGHRRSNFLLECLIMSSALNGSYSLCFASIQHIQNKTSHRIASHQNSIELWARTRGFSTQNTFHSDHFQWPMQTNHCAS